MNTLSLQVLWFSILSTYLIDRQILFITFINIIPERFSSKMVLYLLIKSQKNGRTMRLNDSKHTGSLLLETWLELAKPSSPPWEGYWHQHSLDKFYEVQRGFSNILKHGCCFVGFFSPLYIFKLFWKHKTFSCMLVLFCCLICWSTDLIKVLSVSSQLMLKATKDYMLLKTIWSKVFL